MRKILSVLLALAVLLSASAFACAEGAVAETQELPADLFDIWDYGNESPSWVSTASPIGDGVLIAPVSVKEIPAEQLAVTDGKNTWQVIASVPDDLNQFTLV